VNYASFFNRIGGFPYYAGGLPYYAGGLCGCGLTSAS
tara:strand:- start:240 stop:350 length:111 start_codon:yes stop_codon:yes gene_type:complete